MDIQPINTTQKSDLASLRPPRMNALREACHDYGDQARDVYEGVTEAGLTEDEVTLAHIGDLISELTKAVGHAARDLHYAEAKPRLDSLLECLCDDVGDELGGDASRIVRAHARIAAES